MADHPDIPALMARLHDFVTMSRVGLLPRPITPHEAGDAAAALSRLTRALAERDAELEVRRIKIYRAEERATSAEELLRDRTELIDVAKTGENWPCHACGFGHSASIDAHYEAKCQILAQLAERERDDAREALTLALRERDEALDALAKVRGDA